MAGRAEVLVVGGGIAGLTCAFALAQEGVDVVLLEAADQAGGNVRSERVDGFLMERGPHTVLASADGVFRLAQDAGLAEAVVSTRREAGARFIARGGRLYEAPAGAWSFLSTGLLSWRAKLTLMTEPLRTARGAADDSAETFFQRRFGPEAAEVLAGAFISGVYAGDARALSAAAAFPLFWGFERETGSMVRGALRHQRRQKAARAARGERGPRRRGLFSLAEGLGQLSAGVAAALGPRCRVGHPVERLRRDAKAWRAEGPFGAIEAQRVVLATPPSAASRLLEPTDPTLGGLLAEIPLAPMAVVQMGYRARRPEVPEGFGYLAPRGQGLRALGVLFPSRLFAGRAPAGGDLLTGFVGGSQDPEALALSDGELLDVVLADLERLLGLRDGPDVLRVRRYSEAIPQFVHGHLERMASVHERVAQQPGLQLTGNYLKGVGMKDAVLSGYEAAAASLAELRPAPQPRDAAP